MIVNPSESHIVDSGRHFNPSSIWSCETATRQARYVPTGFAGWVHVVAGWGDLFVACHYEKGSELAAITVRPFSTPESPIAQARRTGSTWRFEGDRAAWHGLPRAYVDQQELLLIDADRQVVDRQQLDWLDSSSYDLGYQTVVGVTEIPNSHLLIVSVSRDSQPVLHDPVSRRKVGQITLAGRRGNPTLRFRKRARELWADDYDTLLRLDPRDWRVLDSLRLQPGSTDPWAFAGPSPLGPVPLPPGAEQWAFIGEFAFNHDESTCAVARPYSGDVVLLDTRTFEVTARAVVGGYPLYVALLGNGFMFARAWETLELLPSVPWQPFSL